MKNEKEVISYIREHYPTTPTRVVAEDLNLTISNVRTIAKRYNITKKAEYLKRLQRDFIESRRNWYEANIPDFNPSFFQEQLIFGSLLGDGYISKGAQRSKNFYYQEHFGEKQREYREWKLEYLKNLGFTINGNYLLSTSHPYFTNLSKSLYPNGEKILTPEFLSKCVHPIFLATLYMDDGSLTISYRFTKSKNIVYCYPSIILYTLCFSKEENQLLANHLNLTYGTKFVVSGHPDGRGSLLKINKESEVSYFLNLISKETKDLENMSYKTDIETNVNLKLPHIKEKYGSDVVIKVSSSERKKEYSEEEINNIIELKTIGITDRQIATKLGRSYWSIVYKISDLRKGGFLK